ncbi:MAG TPA: hypothetical protein VE842_04295, partial [Pyrinomonadaceae bacterium]|nr:hypothetical protein [Pyrinomonadaceae bacterium]
MKASGGKQATVSNHNGARAPRSVSVSRTVSASRVLIARRTRFVARFVPALILVSFLGLVHALPVGAQSRVPVPSYGPMRDAGAAQQTGLPPALLNVRIDQKLDATVPLDATFRDETGRSRRLQEYFGGRKPVILSLVFYECPMLCNQVLNGLTATMKVMPLKIGEDYDVLTVSFDPRETPELAARKKE